MSDIVGKHPRYLQQTWYRYLKPAKKATQQMPDIEIFLTIAWLIQKIKCKIINLHFDKLRQY